MILVPFRDAGGKELIVQEDFFIQVDVARSSNLFARSSRKVFSVSLYAESIIEDEICIPKHLLDAVCHDLQDVIIEKNFTLTVTFLPKHSSDGALFPSSVMRNSVHNDYASVTQSSDDEGETALMVNLVSKKCSWFQSVLSVDESNKVCLRPVTAAGHGPSAYSAWWDFFLLPSSTLSSSSSSSTSDTLLDFGSQHMSMVNSALEAPIIHEIVFHMAQVAKFYRIFPKRSSTDSEQQRACAKSSVDSIIIEFRNGKTLHLVPKDAFCVMKVLSHASNSADCLRMDRSMELYHILNRTLPYSPQSQVANNTVSLTSSLTYIFSSVFPDKEVPPLASDEWQAFGCVKRVADPELVLLPFAHDVNLISRKIHVEPLALELLAYYSMQNSHEMQKLVLHEDTIWREYKVLDISVLLTRMLALKLGIRALSKGERLLEWAQRPSNLLLCMVSFDQKEITTTASRERSMLTAVQDNLPLCKVTPFKLLLL